MSIGKLSYTQFVRNGGNFFEIGFGLIKDKPMDEMERRAAKSFLALSILFFLFVIIIPVILIAYNLSLSADRILEGTYTESGMPVLDKLLLIVGGIVYVIGFIMLVLTTVGRWYVIYYYLTAKQCTYSWYVGAERRRLYENKYIQRCCRKMWYAVSLIIFELFLFGGIALSRCLIVSSVHDWDLSMPVDLVLMIFGIISGVLHIASLVFLAVVYEKLQPLYSAGGNLLDTQILTRNETGKIGFYFDSDNWIELKSAEIKKQDDEIVKLRCTYKILETGKEIKEDNYVLKEDELFYSIMAMAALDSEEGFVFRNPARLIIIAIVYIVLIAGSIWLLKSRGGEMIIPQDGKVEIVESIYEL